MTGVKGVIYVVFPDTPGKSCSLCAARSAWRTVFHAHPANTRHPAVARGTWGWWLARTCRAAPLTHTQLIHT